MDTTEVLKIAIPATVGILFGGVAGAVLNNSVSMYTKRVQPIGRSVRVAVLDPTAQGWAINAQITIDTLQNQHYVVDRLFLVEVEVLNTSNRDFASFLFDITVPDTVSVLDMTPITQDPSHTLVEKEKTTVPSHGVMSKFAATPFNRGDTYTARLVIAPIVTPQGTSQHISTNATLNEVDVKVSTSEAGVTFKEIKEVTQVAVEAINDAGSLVAVLPLGGVLGLFTRMIGKTLENYRMRRR